MEELRSAAEGVFSVLYAARWERREGVLLVVRLYETKVDVSIRNSLLTVTMNDFLLHLCHPAKTAFRNYFMVIVSSADP